MPKAETWAEYVAACSRNAPQADVAYAVGVNQSTVGRWLAGGTPEAKHVVAFAKAYGQKPVAAFIAAGFLSSDDISGPIQMRVSLSDVSDEALVKGLVDRLAHYRRLIGRDEGQEGLVPDGWSEDPRVSRMQNRDKGNNL